MTLDLDAVRARVENARRLFVSGDGDPVPSYAASIVRDDAPALIAEVQRLMVALAESQGERDRLAALLGKPCPHGQYGIKKARCGPCSFDRMEAEETSR